MESKKELIILIINLVLTVLSMCLSIKIGSVLLITITIIKLLLDLVSIVTYVIVTDILD